MQLVEKTQRYWKFQTVSDYNLKFRGISVDNTSAWFPCIHGEHLDRDNLIFTNQTECQNFMELMKMNTRKHTEAIEKINSVTSDFRAVNLVENPNDFEKIKKQMIEPDEFTQDDVKAYSMLLCNNFIDRDAERFQKSVISDFKNSIVGKIRLHDHNTAIKTGKFYEAEIIETSIDEALKLIGYNPKKNIKYILEKVKELDGGIYWLKVKFYVMNRTETEKQRVSDIQAGIDYYTSIRFNCPICEPYYEEGGKDVLFYEWKTSKTERAEALEGSGVWLGSQYGTVNTKGIGGRYYSEKLLQNLPSSFVSHWTGLNEIHDPNLKYYCKQIDDLIERGILYVGNDHNGRRYFYEKSDKDMELEFTQEIDSNDMLFLPVLRVMIDEADKNRDIHNIATINKHLGRLGLIEQEINLNNTQIKGAEKMKLKLTSLGDVEFELTEGNEEQLKVLDDAIQAKFDEMVDSILCQEGEEIKDAPAMTEDDQKQVEFAKAVVKAAGKSDVSVDEIKAAVEDQKKYKAQLIGNILKLERLMKVYENDDKVKAAQEMYNSETVNSLLLAYEKAMTLFNATQKAYEFDGFMLKATPALIDQDEKEKEVIPVKTIKYQAIEL